MVEVKVTFDYQAEQDDELTIKVGDILKNVSMPEGGWWEGELNGKKGMFPDNFVKVLKNPDQKENEKDDILKPGNRASVRDLASKLRSNPVPLGAPPSRRKDSAQKKKMVKVVYNYAPENPDELELEKGDILELNKQEEEGWWEGTLNGKTGVFPSNFVEVIDDKEVEEKSDKSEKEGSEVKGKKIVGVGLGNIFSDGPIKLRSVNATARSKPGEKSENKKHDDISASKKEKAAKAVVRYSYVAENDDELNLNVGDTVNVVNQNLEDAGWWKGEVNGNVGVFPDNFVEIIKEERANGSCSLSVADRFPSVVQPRPRKPTPPTSSVKHQPKLPEKSPAGDPHIPDKVASTDDKHIKKKDDSKHQLRRNSSSDKPPQQPPPALPSKKPVLPPPVGRKPMPPRPTDPPKPETHGTAAEHKDKHLSKEDHIETDAVNLDNVQSSEKLIHLTANRAKGPKKRPPSQFIGSDKEDDKESVVKDEKSSLDKENREEHQREHLPPARPADPVGVNLGVFHSTIDELRKEIQELRSHSVSKAAYNELKAENEKLKSELESFKSSTSRKLRELIHEVDEEKKIRMNTQVDVERVKKLMIETNI